ncbi:hypothetical protein WS68_01300 [Burkholderia sp. TSV86]|nr:hypothetical protein WS68_01300 [Burkholderia sp. TSV86]
MTRGARCVSVTCNADAAANIHDNAWHWRNGSRGRTRAAPPRRQACGIKAVRSSVRVARLTHVEIQFFADE